MFANHLDLSRLKESEALLSELTTGQLDLVLGASDGLDEQLASIYFEGKNYRRLAGPHSIAVGYPFVITSAMRELVSAPLCLWQVRLEPAPTAGQWLLRRESHMPILWNRPLLELLEKEWGVAPPAAEGAPLLGRLSMASLEEWVRDLCARTGWHNGLAPGALAPFPGVEKLGEQTRAGVVWPAAVLGHFPPPEASDQEALPEAAFAPGKTSAPAVALHPLPLTPPQASASHTCVQEAVSAITCTQQAARLEWIAALLGRYYLSGRSCTVVSARAQTLRSLQALLQRFGLSREVLLLTDPWNEHEVLRDTARTALQSTLDETAPQVSPQALQAARRVSSMHAQIEQTYRLVRRPVFGKLNWTETVGLFLQYQRAGGKELLNPQLSPEGFRFTHEEFQQLLEEVRQGYARFQQVDTLRHPLEKLHARFFTDMQAELAAGEVRRLLASFAERLSRLNRDFVRLMDEWASELEAWYHTKAYDLERRLRALRQELADQQAVFGSALLQKRVLRVAPARNKALRKARQTLQDRLDELVTAWPDWPELHIDLPEKSKRLRQLEEILDAYSEKLQQWRSHIATLVHEHLQRLNSQSVPAGFDIGPRVEAHEQAMEALLKELNEAQLLKEPVAHQMLTIPRKRRFLEELSAQLSELQHAMRDFGPFHAWKSYYLGLSEGARKALDALARIRPPQPEAVFASWYLHQVLTRHYHHDLPDGALPFEAETRADVQQAVEVFKQHAQSLRRQQVREALKHLKRRDRAYYRQLTARKAPAQASPLPAQWASGSPLWPQLFPIVLLTSAVAAELRKTAPDYQTDLLILDEANRMPLSEGVALRPMGRQVVASGSRYHLSHATSLLQWMCSKEELPRYHVLPAHLDPFEPWYQPPALWHALDIKGRYDARTDTNEQEAMQVIRQLLKIKAGPDRTYPATGVVCFTRAQRNFIYAQMLRIRQQRLPGADKLEQLERNGLLVLAYDELYGTQFDLLLVSLTYGQVNASGAVSRRLARLDEPEARQALHFLARQQTRSIVWLHSIPSHRLELMEKDGKQPGQQFLARLLAMTRAIEQQQPAKAKEYAQLLGLPIKWKRPTTHFLDQLAEVMRAYVDPRRFAFDYRQGHLLLPCCIRPTAEDAPPQPLIPDAFLAHTRMSAPQWERLAWHTLRQQHMDPLALWSVRWWKDYQTEARKLASQILKRDQQLRMQPTPEEKDAARKETTRKPAD